MIVATDPFRGAASNYARHFKPYPEDLFRSLVRVCGLTNSSRAVDLGAGTGQIAIPLARSVADVLFVDPSDEMVQEGNRIAEAAGVKNINFLVSRSEDLDEPISTFEIATIAGSFHWMNRETVLAKLGKMIKPGGCVAIIEPVVDHSEPGEWKSALMTDLVEFWGGIWPGRPTQRIPHREVLRESDFSDITELRHNFEYHWNIEDLLGWVHGTSLGALASLGDRRDEFSTRVRRLLLSYSPSGFFVERGHVSTMLGYRLSDAMIGREKDQFQPENELKS
ncbi:class I SAM-dependent methyltransferase [Bradyrhizobium vignae]|uniref:Methyltransferase domain-containing protein n=1 Tax=Bradyrhizobium vignae TaxID=1549949 RepID=A0ABS4A3G5_9BRAD|nr:class I SAM-dependent methyltransferase [Bradyrhizobium vignae]MBP0114954.1 methyltransferase domain-containing protein [Bradyrhizobium vignae]